VSKRPLSTPVARDPHTRFPHAPGVNLVHTEGVEPTADGIRRQLARVVESESFVNADRMSAFLRYVVERALAGESEQLKEYVIGLEVFGRGEGYDQRLDSIVRVEARRLRTKLDEYYAREGQRDEVIIRIPRGSYAQTFEQRSPAAVQGSAPVPAAGGEPVRRLWPRRTVPVLAAVVLIVLSLVAVASRSRLASGRVDPEITVAVLPFTEFSSSTADELLAARLTDGVTSELARNPSLGVISRTTAAQMASSGRPLTEVAKALNADIVTEASMTKTGDSVHVSIRLIDPETSRKSWVQDFYGTDSQLEELERRIAQAIAAEAAAGRARQHRN